MRDRELGALRDIALGAAGGKAESVTAGMFRVLYGHPDTAPARHVRQLAVIRAAVERTLDEGPDAVAAAVKRSQRGMAGDPDASLPQQDQQRIVQRRATGLTPDQIADQMATAWADLRQADRDQDLYDHYHGDPDDEDLDQDGGGDPLVRERAGWTEWQRIHQLVTTCGIALYEPGLDPQATAWAAWHERPEQRARRAEQAARARRKARAGAEERDRRDAVHLELTTSGDTGRRLRAWADHHHVTPADLIHQLLAHTTMQPGGHLTTTPFTPTPGERP